tara:strand:+ start:556 stop:978 length:423 start_codon:yes stop_codon:yes gene_type:complete
MANNVKQLMDTDWRVQASATLQADTNAAPGLVLVDISGLERWAAGSKLAVSKVFWSLGTGVATLMWNGTGGGGATTKDAIVMNGGGTYGYSPGQPALLSDAVGTNAVTGDLMIVNASGVTGTIIVECTKHVNASNVGWGG